LGKNRYSAHSCQAPNMAAPHHRIQKLDMRKYLAASILSTTSYQSSRSGLEQLSRASVESIWGIEFSKHRRRKSRPTSFALARPRNRAAATLIRDSLTTEIYRGTLLKKPKCDFNLGTASRSNIADIERTSTDSDNRADTFAWPCCKPLIENKEEAFHQLFESASRKIVPENHRSSGGEGWQSAGVSNSVGTLSLILKILCAAQFSAFGFLLNGTWSISTSRLIKET
jgi:hypothetical protein